MPGAIVKLNWKKLFWILAASMTATMAVLSFDFGITWDEWLESYHGLHTLRYLFSGGTDRAFLTDLHGVYYSHLFYSLVGVLYGLISGTLPALVQDGLSDPAHLLPFFQTSHLINALFGATAVTFTGLLAARLGTWRTACLAAVFLFLSPRFFGHAMNNPKDIPFAATFIAALYFIVVFIEEMPAPRLRSGLFLGLAIAAAIGTRVGGYLLIFYTLFFALLTWVRLSPALLAETRWLRTPLILSGALLIAYFGGLIFWPFGQLNPIVHPFKALSEMSRFSFWNQPVLFEGLLRPASQLPPHYLFKWMAISIPLFAWAGFFLFILFLRPILGSHSPSAVGMIVFSILFPLGYALAVGSVVYDEWRHFLFLYPPLIVLISLGWEALLTRVKTRALKLLAATVFCLHLIEPAAWMIRNHPNEYVYFNPLTGGIQGAAGRYETDYWGNCVGQAAAFLAGHHRAANPNRFLSVRADGALMSSYAVLKNKLGALYSPLGYPRDFLKETPNVAITYPLYLKGAQDWDYAIVLPRVWAPEILKHSWPPPATVHEIKAGNTTLCAVVKNPNTNLR